MSMWRRFIHWLAKERGEDANRVKVGFFTPMDIAPGERLDRESEVIPAALNQQDSNKEKHA